MQWETPIPPETWHQLVLCPLIACPLIALEQRLIALESEFHRDLEIQHEEGSRLTRLVKVLREMAKSDEKLANVLRNFSLL